MIPILGETVWSIIHGPATTSHIFELSQFLRRPIDVWAKDRLLLFGRCHHRHKPRLHLWYKSLTNKCPSCGLSSGKAVGHFTLLEGHEPRNPDARSHPENCGFDVVSDQTGYPATALRQVAVQRMLAKLYESRLRGRDHHFQCSHCNLSGGELWTDEDSKKLIKTAQEKYRGHAHIHVYRESCDIKCSCAETDGLKTKEDGGLKNINCMDKFLQINNDGKITKKTLFECEQDLIECLTVVMNNDPAQAAKLCFELNHWPSCEKYHYDRHRACIETDVGGLNKRGYVFTWNEERNRRTNFYFEFKYVRTILKSRFTGTEENSTRELYLETMYPLQRWVNDIERDRDERIQ
uniref:Uncharacterized protein n=1 Tax=Trichogramma kaykai TaxID=54128 RepID=A0ABD2XLQ2_9HYME